MQLDARRGGDGLALVDEGVHEVAEIGRLGLGGEVRVVGEAGERGDGVHRGVEDQLGPLRGPQIGKRLDAESRTRHQGGDVLHGPERRRLVRPDPGLGVEHVLDVRVGVARAAHEGDARDDRPVADAAHGLLGAEAVQHRHDRRVRKAPAQRRRGRLEAAGLGRDDAEVERWQRGGSAEARTRDRRSLRPLMRSPSRSSAAASAAPARQDRDVRDRGQMAREEAADGARPDDAHALHAATALPARREFDQVSRARGVRVNAHDPRSR